MNGREPMVHTLGERRRAALAAVDEAPFSLFHIKICFVAGVGFFTDAYDTFAISIAATMLGYLYGNVTTPHESSPPDLSSNDGLKGLSPNIELGLKVAGPVGTLVGQIIFGWLADIVGRKRMYGFELCIIIIATLAQAMAGSAQTVNILGVIIFWRVIMGLGIGGDYPLSAVISSEFAATKSRGRLMNAVFASQGWGNFAAALVSLIVVSAYKTGITNDSFTDPRHVDFCWRLLIGLGCVPGAVALYFRFTVPETPRFTMDIERNVQQASQDVETFLTNGTFFVDPDAVVQRAEAPKASCRDFIEYFGRWENMKVLIGTSWSWLALDIAFYGLGLNSSNILQAINFGERTGMNSEADIYQNLKNVSIGNLILAVAGLIPGYYACMIFIDSWGRKPIQLMGFTVLTIIFAIMGFGYDKIRVHNGAFVFLYCLASFFLNFGPNTTTFTIPGEVFPTRYRSTAHGISAASGKLGAIIAQVGFARLKDIGGKDAFMGHIFEIFAFFMLTGIASTLLLPETNQRTLEELSNERQGNFIRGVTTNVEMRNGILSPVQ